MFAAGRLPHNAAHAHGDSPVREPLRTLVPPTHTTHAEQFQELCHRCSPPSSGGTRENGQVGSFPGADWDAEWVSPWAGGAEEHGTGHGCGRWTMDAWMPRQWRGDQCARICGASAGRAFSGAVGFEIPRAMPPPPPGLDMVCLVLYSTRHTRRLCAPPCAYDRCTGATHKSRSRALPLGPCQCLAQPLDSERRS